MENPIKMDDLGVPLFSETSILVSTRHHPLRVGFVGFLLHSGGKKSCIMEFHVFFASFPILSWPFVARCSSFQTNALSFMVATTLR